jgi:ppGpp synthetase/RelA/SpoT-type nucleotidyltranferase
VLWDAEVDEALDVIAGHRGAHEYPLKKATARLRSALRSEGCQTEVTQRLKRFPTILNKLIRLPTMQLASMQDIGGCRAVLASIDEIRRVERRLARNRSAVRHSDYISAPRSTGYRGVHVVLAYLDRDRIERAIEIQLRTRLMHEWADTVEQLSANLDVDLKSGSGPTEVLQLLKTISHGMAMEEAGRPVSVEFADAITRLRRAALPFMRSSPR